MKVGGGSISGVASRDLRRAEESLMPDPVPGLAQLQSRVAHQLRSLGTGAGFSSLGLSVPV